MERRQYLAAAAAGGAIGVGGVGGYVMLSDDVGFGSPGVAAAPYPPYPTADGGSDVAPISLSGTGQTTTDSFTLQRDGPTIIETDAGDADADERFLVALVSATEETEYRVIEVLGPFTGRNLINPPSGEYQLAVQQASADWTATIHDVPAYDTTGEIDLEIEPPVAFSDGLDTVIGPIDFGTQQPVEFSLTADADVEYNLSLIDSNGERAELLIQSIVGQTDPQVREVGGVGYLAVDTNTTWTLHAEPVDDTQS